MDITVFDKHYQDKKQAIIALAFCHYPVTVQVGDKSATFESFDKAKEFVDQNVEE